MSYSPEMVNIFIPLMKNLNMSWEELKRTPRRELIGLLTALSEYNILHSFDGYTDKHIGEMSKDNGEVRQQYADYKAAKRKYSNVKDVGVKSFRELF